MYKNLRTKDGKKLYAVCKWESNQHKIYNAYDRAMIRCYEEGTEEAFKHREKIETALKWIDNVKDDGLVYAPWGEYKLIKELIGGYDLRHDFIR